MKPILGLTMGDPTGIGPEILLKSAAHPLLKRETRPIVFGDFEWLVKSHHHFKKKGLRLAFPFFPVKELDSRPPQDGSAVADFRGNDEFRGVPVVDFGLLKSQKLVFGVSSSWGGFASGVYIREAVRAVQTHVIDGIVTLPINKESFKKGKWGTHYAGHTEMLARLTGASSAALMLATDQVRAVHVTQHIALKEVSKTLTRKKIKETVRMTHVQLRSMGIKKPRIAVCGLNPHAGDGGLFGNEEITKIAPAVRALQRSGLDVEGPLPADVLWRRVLKGKYDAGVAMYHDQGQIPVKMSGRPVVNLTLGLPIVRTSVGHGTGYDIAGQGRASTASFLEAVRMAARLIMMNNRQKKPS